ncbi:MAG TPA: hypothetical protein VMW83_14345 [Spirochaetia bacterium]|nr:hypothetical protein [Spirochaetia bacterium]
MPSIDTPVKRMLQRCPGDWARFFQPDCRDDWVCNFKTNFVPMKQSNLDSMFEIADPNGPYLLHLEPQGYYGKALPVRMLRYRSDIWEATLSEGRGMPPIKQVVIFFYEDDDNGLHRLQDRWDGGILEYGYTVFRVWDVYRRRVTEAELVGLYPLLPLMRGDEPDESPEHALKESVSTVEAIADESLKQDLLATMAILAEGRYPPDLVLSFIRREMIMKSAVFQEWVKEESAEAETRGKVSAKQEDICKFLNARFGDISRELEGRVKRIGKLDALDKVIDKIYTADSLKDATDVVDDAAK